MCGIIGKIQFHHPIDPLLFKKQCDSLYHRGPDDSGVWFGLENCIALGSRRLAIQDLSPAGHMPMRDSSGQVWIVFNGEIYNFQSLRNELEKDGYIFQSSTDTEVILNAYEKWGVECLSRLNGMFAFAICDLRKKNVFLARDRAGEKPLYYWHHANGFSFASELKSLMLDPDMPRRLNLHAFSTYLSYGYVPGEMCILQGVKKLPPAHAMLYEMQTGKTQIWKYWRLPDFQSNNLKHDELIEELDNLLQKSVKEKLVADVPVGILLSGGIDSSLITAMAARVSAQQVKTFTIAFPGHGKYNESRYARLVANYFGTDHHELIAEPASVELLPELAKYYDEPLADSSLVPTYLVSRLTKQYVTVALGGDGGDELFGGYPYYSMSIIQEKLRKYIPKSFHCMGNLLASHLPVGLKGRNYLLSLMRDRKDVISRGYFDIFALKNILTHEVSEKLAKIQLADMEVEINGYQANQDIVEYLTRLDFKSYLPDDILAKVDRASMSVSLETRVPFLDQHIIEFAFGKIPAFLKANAGERKILLRKLAKRVLPPDLDLERKQGFSLPLASWFKGEWGNFVKDVLTQADSNLFSQKAIQNLIQGQKRGLSNTSRLFALTMFELWRRVYKVNF